MIGVVGDVVRRVQRSQRPETCVYFPTNGARRGILSLLVRIAATRRRRDDLDTALEKVAPSAADLIIPWTT